MALLSTREFDKDKNANFSEWYNSIIYAADLADIRYNVQGFIVHRPWSMKFFKKLYAYFETTLEEDNHEPVLFPTVIPEENFAVEKEHAEGFKMEVYWITQRGDEKMQRRLALRPTSETAFYQMYNLWIKSYSDLPLKLYQSCTVFRNESETNPFLRGREFLWIETHDAFASQREALQQVAKDGEIAGKIIGEQLCIPFFFFRRPHWDKFPGAEETYAIDTLLPDGKAFQVATTHYLGENFSKAFNVKFTNEQGKEHFPHTTCFGPGIWRMMAAVVAVHGDNKGLIFPFTVAPLQVIIVPIPKAGQEDRVNAYAEKVAVKLKAAGISAKVDSSSKTPGFKYNFWELKGVPLRVEVGAREVENANVTIARRDNRTKTQCTFEGVVDAVQNAGQILTDALRDRASVELEKKVHKAESKEEVLTALDAGGYAKTFFCSVEKDGENCGKELQTYTKGGKVRGEVYASSEKVGKAKCVVCGQAAKHVVYVARQY